MPSGRFQASIGLVSWALFAGCLISPKDYPLDPGAESSAGTSGAGRGGTDGVGSSTAGKSGKAGSSGTSGGASNVAGTEGGGGELVEGGADGTGTSGSATGGSSGGNAGNAGGGQAGTSGAGGVSGSGGSNGGSGGSNGGCPGALTGLSVRYVAEATQVTSPGISAQLKILNQGAGTVALEDLRLRYYFTNELPNPQTILHWARFGPASNLGQVNVNLGLVAMPAATATADFYVELSFPANASAFSPGYVLQASWGLNDSNKDVNQSNDYSFSASQTIDSDYSKIVLLKGDCVLWGSEP
jgi:hypothetical protein